MTSINHYTVRGPYRRRRTHQKATRALSWVAAFALLGLLLIGMFGCSPASDSQIEELIALELADAANATNTTTAIKEHK